MLARLWHKSHTFRIGAILTKSAHSAQQAVRQIGAGHAIAGVDLLPAADIFLIATSDQAIGAAAKIIAHSGVVANGNIICHLSGATPSAVLTDAGFKKAAVASVHPIHSFGNFDRSVERFNGTWCGFEGGKNAAAILKPGLHKIGANTFDIDPDRKLAYHAACLMMSNYLTALVDAGLDCFALAGIDRQTALTLSAPILQNTIDNIIANGPAAALTGPIARGEWQLVEAELKQLRRLDSRQAEIYRQIGLMALFTAKSAGGLSNQQIANLQRVLAQA